MCSYWEYFFVVATHLSTKSLKNYVADRYNCDAVILKLILKVQLIYTIISCLVWKYQWCQGQEPHRTT